MTFCFMYLEKLEIQGFKSFANKNILVFPGLVDKTRRGITAIVGPNGSGKSNTADAVRWALGEQSMKTLRGKKSEDIIFSGSDKKGKLGMAEVSLFLNNEGSSSETQTDGENYEPLSYSQIVITRRLYRDGESEYLLNNSRVRLSDIQILLAKAKFGQKTYSVIGQGMVEGFLNTSLAERKEFFDEATGVKQFQIKRDESLNKLLGSYENLNQANMLLIEIEPRLKSLTRQVNKLKRRDEIEAELKVLQLDYYSKIWHEINGNFSEYNKKFLEIEKTKLEKEKKLSQLNRELSEMEKQNKENQEFITLQKELSSLQAEKDSLTKQLARLEAQLELKLEASGQFDLSWLSNKKTEIKKEIESACEEIEMLERNVSQEKSSLTQLQNEMAEINTKVNRVNQNLIEYGSNLGGKESKELTKELEKLSQRLVEAEMENDINKIKIIIKEISQDLKKLLALPAATQNKDSLENLRDQLFELTKIKEEVANKINESNFRISARSERVKLIREKNEKLIAETKEIENKLTKNSAANDSKENTGKQKELLSKLNELDNKLKEAKDKLNIFNSKEEEKRSRLFSLQRNLQNLQNEINQFNNELGELKINSTRYETRLEDLEIEIRNNFGGLKEIREHKAKETIDVDSTLEKINSLKRQIEQIGGIDPEIEKEYNETKERYDFLSGQVNDLDNAINSLEEIIKELDTIIKERFDKEFKVISSKFEEYFKILFNGGQAKIIKVIADEVNEDANGKQTAENTNTNLSDIEKAAKVQNDNIKRIKFLQKNNSTGLAGIEIQATPPGKKIKNISMLSGGERALTAIALICAIISANPSPFVMLDEVDASLDEANSERLAKILDDLSHKTQFISITHNRATMRRANILYGVTMGDDGVSKLLSIKLEDAKAK